MSGLIKKVQRWLAGNLERAEQGCIAPEHFPIASLSTLLQGPELPPRPPDNNLVFGGSCVTAGTKGG